MNQKADLYTYRITWSIDDREYVGLCLEFPGLSWLAKSPEAALRGIRKVVAEAVRDIQKSGQKPPTPISGKSFTGRFIVRIPPRVHRSLAIQAAEEGISLNRLVSAKLSIP